MSHACKAKRAGPTVRARLEVVLCVLLTTAWGHYAKYKRGVRNENVKRTSENDSLPRLTRPGTGVQVRYLLCPQKKIFYLYFLLSILLYLI